MKLWIAKGWTLSGCLAGWLLSLGGFWGNCCVFSMSCWQIKINKKWKTSLHSKENKGSQHNRILLLCKKVLNLMILQLLWISVPFFFFFSNADKAVYGSIGVNTRQIQGLTNTTWGIASMSEPCTLQTNTHTIVLFSPLLTNFHFCSSGNLQHSV